MAAERVLLIEQRILSIEEKVNKLGTLEETVKQLANASEDMGEKLRNLQTTVFGLGEGVTQLGIDVTAYAGSLATEKAKFTADVNSAFDDHKAALSQVVSAAREEFLNIKGGLTGLHGQTAQTFQEVKTRVELLEVELRESINNSGAGGTANTGGGGHKGFLPIKSLVPSTFSGNDEQWRSWQDDVADYLDTLKVGMKGLLKAAEREAGPIDGQWLSDQLIVHPASAVNEGSNVFRALKALTTGEARVVVQGIRDENGFLAWRALHQRFGPSVAAKQGKVMCDLSAMVAKPAKSPADTRALVTELERRVRVAEDVTGDTLGDSHLKSILASILDPTTRAHTSAFQGVSTSYQELKRVVLEFVNNNITSKVDQSEPMNIGKCEEHIPQQPWAGDSDEEFEAVGDYIGAVGAQTQCYQCGGYGHLAHACPTPKGKGKGFKGGTGGGSKGGKGDKGGGKGFKGGGKGGKGGKGPATGCWTCGGQHFASDCPYGKGGGKGGKGVKGGYNMMAQYWPEPGSPKPLCSLRTIKPEKIANERPQVETSNRFQELSPEDDSAEGEERATKATLADFMPSGHQPKLTQKQKKQQQPQQQRPQVGALKGQPAAARLSPLVTIEPEGLRPVMEAPEWESIELAVDSGASETVIPEDTVRAAKLCPSEASKRGVQYEVANGARIANLGQKTFSGVTEAGLVRGVTAQVCDVNKPLLSVHKLVQAGNTVVFSQQGAYVQDDATQERMWLQEAGGMYMLKLWVPAEGF